MNRKYQIILGALAILIGVDIALILYMPTYTGPPPTPPQLHPLEEVNGIGVGDIVVVNRNGSWELSSVQYPGGVLKGEKYNGSYNYHPTSPSIEIAIRSPLIWEFWWNILTRAQRRTEN